jgi:signal peptidase I
MRKLVRETLETVIIAAAIALVIRVFVFEPFYVKGPSMEPTFLTGDRLIVSKFTYRFSPSKRGDIIVFKYPRQPDSDFVKRVIAIGGETVEIRMGRVYINGQPFEETFATRATLTSYPKTDVPRGTVFVLGDNRSNSEDSRYFGFVPLDNIKGKAVILYWPFPRAQLLTGSRTL